jgi:hypothetical protein
VRCHLLCNLQFAAVFEINRDAGRPKSVTSDLGLDPGRESSPPNHSPDIGLEQGIGGQLAGSPARRAKERAFSGIVNLTV